MASLPVDEELLPASAPFADGAGRPLVLPPRAGTFAMPVSGARMTEPT